MIFCETSLKSTPLNESKPKKIGVLATENTRACAQQDKGRYTLPCGDKTNHKSSHIWTNNQKLRSPRRLSVVIHKSNLFLRSTYPTNFFIVKSYSLIAGCLAPPQLGSLWLTHIWQHVQHFQRSECKNGGASLPFARWTTGQSSAYSRCGLALAAFATGCRLFLWNRLRLGKLFCVLLVQVRVPCPA